MLGCVYKDPEIGTDATLQLGAELHILIEKILDRRNHPIIYGAAEGTVGDEALRHVAFVIFFTDCFFHNPQVDAVHDLEGVIGT